MRPVPIWKSTDAAPTPTSDGPCEVPSPPRPWQDEQVRSNRALPSSICCVISVSAEERWGLTTL